MMKTTLLQLTGIILLFMAPVALRLGDSDVVDHMETFSLLSAQEVWLRQHAGDPESWLTPTLGGEPRINKPPMLQWITGLAWMDLTPETSTFQQCVWRARMIGALLTLLAILSTYALAFLLGGRSFAWMSGLVLATMLTVIGQSRLACYDTHLFAWTTLSVSAGYWLIARGETWSLFKRTATALLSSAALTLALLTKGPIALLFVGLPVGLAVFHFREPSRSFRATATAIILLPGMVILLCWFLFIATAFGDSADALLREYRAARGKSQPLWFYLSIAAWIIPWTFSFLGSVLLFRLRKAQPLDRTFTIPSIWVGLILLVMSLHESKRERYLVPVMPAVAMFVACWWSRLASNTLPQRWIRGFRSTHVALLVLGSLIFAAVVPLYPFFLRAHLVKQPSPPSLSTGVMAVATLCLLGLAWAVWKCITVKPQLACILTGVWMAAIFSIGLGFYLDTGNAVYGDKTAAEELCRRVTTPHLWFLRSQTYPAENPNTRFILYSRKIMRPLTQETLLPTIRTEQTVWLLTKSDASLNPRLESLGFRFMQTFTERKASWSLFLRERRDGGADQAKPKGSG